jgi:ribosome-associated protein
MQNEEVLIWRGKAGEVLRRKDSGGRMKVKMPRVETGVPPVREHFRRRNSSKHHRRGGVFRRAKACSDGRDGHPYLHVQRTLIDRWAAVIESPPSPMRAAPKNNQRSVIIREEPIELSQFLKFGGLAGTGGEAKQLISDGKVQLNGVVERQKGKKLKAGDRVTLGEQTIVVQVE